MELADEAGYLYYYSKKLKKVNRNLRRLSGKAQQYAKDFNQASDKNKDKYRKKHHHVKEELKEVMNIHQRLMTKLKHHLVRFHDAFRKTGKL